MKYTEQQIWHQLMKQLPEQLHYTKDYQPTEEVWNWKGNKIHLDTFRNTDAKAKLLLFWCRYQWQTAIHDCGWSSCKAGI